MLEEDIRKQIIALINREVVPAVGCTEPMCVSLCVARATELLGCRPEKITASLSANILKSAILSVSSQIEGINKTKGERDIWQTSTQEDYQ